MPRFQTLLLTLSMAAAPFAVAAQQTERLLDDTIAHFNNGDLTTSTLTHDGRVAAPLKRSRLGNIEADVVWDVAVGADGRRFIATGHEGKLFVQQGDGDATVRHDFDENALYTIEPHGDGAALVGASPGGIIYRVPEADDGTVEELAGTGQRAIWDLLPREDGGVLVATGLDAKVLRLNDDGTTETLASFEDVDNVLDLEALPGSDDVVAATQGRGYVLRISPDGSYKVLIDPDQEEVRRVAVMSDRSVLGAVNGVRSPGERFLEALGEEGRPSGNQKPGPSSFIVRSHPDGFAEEFWTSPESPIHDIYVTEDDHVIVAAGSQGRLYRVTPEGETDFAGLTGEDLVTVLADAPDGQVFAGTGATAALYRLVPTRYMPGEFHSRIFDVAATVQWGRAYAEVENPAAGDVLFSARSGNTADPDDGTWSEWTEPAALGDDPVAIGAPVSRFLQYRLQFDKLAGDAAESPRVDMVRLFYGRRNAAPRITEVTVGPPEKEGGRERGPKQDPREGRLRVGADAAPDALEVSWNAKDPNDDFLLYDVYLRHQDQNDWMTVEEDIPATKAPLQVNLLPDGFYRARVVAQDWPQNPGPTSQQAEAISEAFLVDNSQPEVTVASVQRSTEEEVTLRVRASDAFSLIAGLSWRQGLDDWNPVAPEDDLLDQRTETFVFTITGEAAAPGSLISLIVTDEAGNSTVVRAQVE